MSASHLRKFIVKKSFEESNTIVLTKKGKKVSLDELYQELGIPPQHLNLDMLDV